MKMVNTIRLPRMHKQNVNLLYMISLILICALMISIVQPAFTSGSSCEKEEKELEKATKELTKASKKVKQTKNDLDFARGLLAEAEKNGNFADELVAVIAIWWTNRAHEKAKAKHKKAEERVEKAKKALEDCKGRHAAGGCESGNGNA